MQDGLYGEGFWLMNLLFINNLKISKKQKRLRISCWNGSQPSRRSRRCEFVLHFLVQFLRNPDDSPVNFAANGGTFELVSQLYI